MQIKHKNIIQHWNFAGLIFQANKARSEDGTPRRVWRIIDWLNAGALDIKRPFCKTSEIFLYVFYWIYVDF